MAEQYRLIRIGHIRCMDYQGTTFVMAPTHWNNAEVGLKIADAQKAYQRAIDAAKNEDDAPPQAFSPPYDEFPDRTVREVKAVHEERKLARKIWEEERRKTTRGFEQYLTDQGFKTLYAHADADDAFEVDWGHQHRTRIDYDETATDTLPTPAKLAGQKGDDYEE